MPNAMIFYSIARWLYLKKIPLIPKLFQLLIFVLYSCRLPYKANIGKGSFFVVKGLGVSLHDNTVIGENCSIGISCKTVGKSPFKKVPSIGNNVFLGPGCVIVGPVIIEDDVIVAPNSVVTKSVPKGSIVGGIPAKILGSVYELNYDISKNIANDERTADYMLPR
ncbi:MAG: serine O-acetyltransferase [Francisellaceae bacterium]|jgi:serine O-acetyltransferase